MLFPWTECDKNENGLVAIWFRWLATLAWPSRVFTGVGTRNLHHLRISYRRKLVMLRKLVKCGKSARSLLGLLERVVMDITSSSSHLAEACSTLQMNLPFHMGWDVACKHFSCKKVLCSRGNKTQFLLQTVYWCSATKFKTLVSTAYSLEINL